MIKSVPTNIITGFLGVGKSTAIMHLLKTKPKSERWAVLVNEFGEVGIDGGMLSGNSSEEQGVFIKEVPGGCMCCTAGLPMQIALNMLLARAKPDRLLIEPTGLGHPKEVLDTLFSKHYKDILDIQRTLTLVDARKVKDVRYTGHDIFRQQIEIADVVVANKTDLYDSEDFTSLVDFINSLVSRSDNQIHKVSNGSIDINWLYGSSSYCKAAKQHHHHHHLENQSSTSLPLPGEDGFPNEGYLSISNEGEGFFSKGWIFEPSITFNKAKLYDLLITEQVERLKAIFITEEGIIAYNKVDDVLTELYVDESPDSRIELIADNTRTLENFEEKLIACMDTDTE